jgi:hypothetical protein
MRKQLALAGTLATLMGIGGIAADTALAQDPEGGNQVVTEPGEATGLLTNVDATGGFIEVDGVRYMVGEGVDLGDLTAGQQVTVHYEGSDIGTVPMATEIETSGG